MIRLLAMLVVLLCMPFVAHAGGDFCIDGSSAYAAGGTCTLGSNSSTGQTVPQCTDGDANLVFPFIMSTNTSAATIAIKSLKIIQTTGIAATGTVIADLGALVFTADALASSSTYAYTGDVTFDLDLCDTSAGAAFCSSATSTAIGPIDAQTGLGCATTVCNWHKGEMNLRFKTAGTATDTFGVSAFCFTLS